MYDYELDIGCFFALEAEGRMDVLAHLERLLRTGGLFMLYACLPCDLKGRRVGLSIEQVHQLLARALTRERMAVGEEKGHGSEWYWYRRSRVSCCNFCNQDVSFNKESQIAPIECPR